ncbi:MAG: hypothetical protein FJ096_03575 [Deltaproteobacteria bacterium]|nr:hypothetical protein [Deltaproteobacteria bacterium]
MSGPHHGKSSSARRAFLAGLAGLAASWVDGGHAEAAKKKARQNSEEDGEARHGKLVASDASPMGVTLTFALDHAPFPSPAQPYTDRTVLVFVPRYFRLEKDGRLDAVIHFHGHNNTALAAVESHQLREQLVESKQNAVLVAPQGPVRAADSSGGKLEHKGGLRRMLDELTAELGRPAMRKLLGPSATSGARRFGTLCLSAHSGGFQVAAACCAQGGVEVAEVYLFDALYGAVPTFRAWLNGSAGKRGSRRKLVSTYATAPVRTNNLTLLAELRADGVEVLHEQRPGELSRKELTDGRAIFIASPLDHVGVTHRHNNLRDCLFASQLRRHQKSDWFSHRDGARPIDSR